MCGLMLSVVHPFYIVQTSQPLTGGGVSSLYLILSKEHRVSRSIRTKWYIDHLFTDINTEEVSF